MEIQEHRERQSAARMIDSQALFAPIEVNDAVTVARLIKADPGLAHVHRAAAGLIGQTPLQAAAEAGHVEIVRFLISHGADAYQAAQCGYPAIWHAHQRKQARIVALLTEADAAVCRAPTYGLGIDVNLAAREGWRLTVCEHLQRDPLAIYRRGVTGETPLHWAACNDRLEIVMDLVDAGADIEADEIGCFGGKPLHWAAERAPKVVNYLMARGARVDSRNHLNGRTPLIHCAAQSDDCVSCVELLLLEGADPTAFAADGRTALETAVESGNERIASLLRAGNRYVMDLRR
jgi:ankyrin repeat protein